jgi:hypothetical protein
LMVEETKENGVKGHRIGIWLKIEMLKLDLK